MEGRLDGTGWRLRPLPGDVVLAVAVLLAGALATQARSRAGSWLEEPWPVWLLVAAVHVPLLWRRGAPVAVFWAVWAGVAMALVGGADGAFTLFVPAVSIYSLARFRPRRYVWPALLGFVVPWALLWLVADLRLWGDVVAVWATLALSVLAGLNLRTRNAYLAELEERARSLERQRDQQARLSVAAERARIAREMHDVVTHNLTVMVALADGAALTAPGDPGRAASAMTEVSAVGRQALGDMRRLLGVLGGEDAQAGGGNRPQPGLGDLADLVERVGRTGLLVSLTEDGGPGEWGPVAGLTVYRIVQEGLTNTMKHAGPRARAQVRVTYSADAVEVVVTDDGAGRPPAGDGTGRAAGHGLAGIRERVEAWGGTVLAGPGEPGGWHLRVRLPLAPGEPG
jgi:signal transduction histidine kinase